VVGEYIKMDEVAATISRVTGKTLKCTCVWLENFCSSAVSDDDEVMSVC
jgi:hypothetical protein